MSHSINPEHVITLQGQQYCTYRGVLDLAHSLGLEGIRTRILQIPGADNEHVAIVEAEVRLKDGRVFADVADASPKNVNSRLASALIRLASTRAKGRALRDAVNIGEALAEELVDIEPEHALPPAATPRSVEAPAPTRPAPAVRAAAPAPVGDGEARPAPAPVAAAAAPAATARSAEAPAIASRPAIPARAVAAGAPGDGDPRPAPAPVAAPPATPTAAPAETAARPPAEPEEAPAVAERAGEMVCSSAGCGRTVTQGQYNFSMTTYGVPLCPACQRKKRAVQERAS